jgi:hypothetical protein
MEVKLMDAQLGICFEEHPGGDSVSEDLESGGLDDPTIS